LKYSLVIRMGAPHWDATLHSQGTATHFDFRLMNTDQRKAWYGAFMDTVRRHYPGKRARMRRRGGRRNG
jgi:hypothetical protein